MAGAGGVFDQKTKTHSLVTNPDFMKVVYLLSITSSFIFNKFDNILDFNHLDLILKFLNSPARPPEWLTVGPRNNHYNDFCM